MSKIRVRYKKTGTAKYISHLDLMATMQRAFLRSGFGLKYSEGFNPHPYMSVALPLSVGCSSECELLDVGLIDDIMPDINNISLPEGITIIDAYVPTRKFNEIVWVEISWKLYYKNHDREEVIKRLEHSFNRDSIIISKKTKRGSKELDLAPYKKDMKFCNDDDIMITAKISAQEPTLNPADLESVIPEDIKPDFTDFKRIDIYDSNMVQFK